MKQKLPASSIQSKITMVHTGPQDSLKILKSELIDSLYHLAPSVCLYTICPAPDLSTSTTGMTSYTAYTSVHKYMISCVFL